MNLYNEFFSIIASLEKKDITYAVIGGFALAFHDEPRYTEDIDILINDSDLDRVKKELNTLEFFKSTDPHHFLKIDWILHRFLKTERSDYLIVDIISGSGKEIEQILDQTILYDWEKGKIKVVSKTDLINLKRIRNSDQDKVDIKNLKNNEKKDRGGKKG